MSKFIKESDEYILIKFTLEEIEKIGHIVNHLLLTENQEEIFTHHDIETIANANKYTNLLFYYALCLGQNIETHQGEKSGGGVINATIFFILLLLMFNTVLVDAGILKNTSLHFKPIHNSISHQKISQNTIQLSKTVIELSTRLHKYTPPLLTDVTNVSTMTRHTATIAEMTTKKQIQKVCNYIIQKILLRKIKGTIQKKILFFIHSCFIKEIAPLFFPELQGFTIQFADVILWCIQNKIPETFEWGKNRMKDLSEFYNMQMIQPMNEVQLANRGYLGGKKKITQKTRLHIRSKKNIKHRKKNTKITMKKTMMNGVMIPK